MRTLVTGSNGFIGSFLVEKLLAHGHQVRCLVRQTSNVRWLANLPVEFCYGELRDRASLRDAVTDVDLVFHLGGLTRGRTEQDYIDSNYTATLNLLEACQAAGHAQQKFVFVSSQAAGGPSRNGQELTEAEAIHPISFYGRSKRLAELAVLEFASNRPATIVRPPSVYGPRDKDFFALFKNSKFGFMPVVGSGAQPISLIYIADLIEGIYLAGTNAAADGELFFLSSDEQATFAEIARAIAMAMGKNPRLLNVPLPAVSFIATVSALSSHITKKPALINKDKVAEMQQPGWLCSNAKAKRLLGFQPQTSLAAGMRTTAEWYKSNNWL